MFLRTITLPTQWRRCARLASSSMRYRSIPNGSVEARLFRNWHVNYSISTAPAFRARWFSSSPAPSIEEEVKEANERYRGILEIRLTEEKGWGLFATRKIGVGEQVLSAQATSVGTEPDHHSVQTGWKQHVQVDLPTRFINHSCSANVGLKDNDKGAYDFYALEEIDQDAELVWDYEASEYEILYDGDCLCGSPVCRGKLRGYKHHGRQVEALYGADHVAAYLKDHPTE